MVKILGCHSRRCRFESCLLHYLSYELLMFFSDLYALIVYLICAIVISYVAFLISYIFGIRADDSNKLSAYECGFTPFDDARNTFEVHFYLVAILFLMFDLEISFLFPWAVSLSTLSFIGYSAMVIFLILLTIGFIYEYKKGALEWE